MIPCRFDLDSIGRHFIGSPFADPARIPFRFHIDAMGLPLRFYWGSISSKKCFMEISPRLYWSFHWDHIEILNNCVCPWGFHKDPAKDQRVMQRDPVEIPYILFCDSLEMNGYSIEIHLNSIEIPSRLIGASCRDSIGYISEIVHT